MQELKLKDHEVQSLKDLQEHFEPNEIRNAFKTGTLEQWLRDRYYDQEADTVASLCRRMKETDSEPEKKNVHLGLFRNLKHLIRQEQNVSADASQQTFFAQRIEYMLCQVLDVNYADVGMMTPEERANYDRKLGALQQFTDDSKLLGMAMETATNQSELARLLNSGYQTIILCNAPFSVPISKGGIHYICVGNVTLDGTLTVEHYRRAGIIIEKVELPDVTDETMASKADKSEEVNSELEFIRNAKERAQGNPFKFINIILGTNIPENTVVFPGQPEFKSIEYREKAEIPVA